MARRRDQPPQGLRPGAARHLPRAAAAAVLPRPPRRPDPRPGPAPRPVVRRGLLPQSGWFGDCPLYDGRAIEAFADPVAAEEASRAGNLRIADDAAGYLRIRRCDFDH